MFVDKLYKNREDAARRLLPDIGKYKNHKNAVILAIPRGALEIGAVLRDSLNIPLDIIVTKKISAPGNEEYAIGSVSPDGSVQVDQNAIMAYGIPQSYINNEAERLTRMIRRRYEEYRGDPEPPDLKGKVVIVTDDGIATGFTVMAAIRYVRKQNPKKIILVAPVSASDSYEKLKKETDEIICPAVREDFFAVGQFYETFDQVSDEDAKKLLDFNKNKAQ